MNNHLLQIAIVALSVFAAGCVSEAELRSRRINDNIQTFASFDQQTQRRIQAGSVSIGDSTDAAWMALGDPSSKTVQANGGGTVEIWNYTRMTVEYYDVLVNHDPWMFDPPPPPPGRHWRHRHPPFPEWHIEERSRLVEVPRMQLVFTNGSCSSITTF